MRGWFSRMTYRLRCFMQGRYGMDELSVFLTVLGMVFAILSMFPFLEILGIFAFASIAWGYVRCFSRNYDRRRRERAKYLTLKNSVSSKWSFMKRRFRERKTHRYYKCPMCKTVLRVPRGRGKIKINCPKCKNSIIRKT